MILALLEENDLAKGKREERLFELSDQMAASQWLSTQERNSLFLAGRTLLGKPEANWTAQLTSGGETRELNNGQSGLKLEGALLTSPLTLRNQGSEPIYQQLSISGYPQQSPAAGGENLSIRREYLGMNGQPQNLHNLNSGDLVLVHLTVSANKQRVPDALVVDLLPAGLELENQNLAQSAASLENTSSQVKEWRESMQNASLKHQEFRDDRYVAALNLDGYGTTHLLYLARAVTPGTYRVPPPQVESMYRPNWQAVGGNPGGLGDQGLLKLIMRGRAIMARGQALAPQGCVVLMNHPTQQPQPEHQPDNPHDDRGPHEGADFRVQQHQADDQGDDADDRGVHAEGLGEAFDKVAAGIGQHVEQSAERLDDKVDDQANFVTQPSEKICLHVCVLVRRWAYLPDLSPWSSIAWSSSVKHRGLPA